MKNREFITQLLQEDLDDEVCILTANHQLVLVDGIANDRVEGTQRAKIAVTVDGDITLKMHDDEDAFQHFLTYTGQTEESEELIDKLRQAFLANL
jgi:hypothetical protein